jgi:hypothetical protein
MKPLMLALMLILASSQALGYGISPSRTLVEFQPGFSREYRVRAINDEQLTAKVVVSVSGELAEYIEILTPQVSFAPGEEHAEVRFRLSLPENMEYGVHMAELRFTRLVTAEGISAQIMLAHPLRVNVPPELSHVSARLAADEQSLHINVTNPLARAAEGVWVSLELHDEGLAYAHELSELTVPAQGWHLVSVEHDLMQGEYQAKYTIVHKAEIDKEQTIAIGRPDPEFRYSTPVFYAGEINPLSLDVINNWNREYKALIRSTLEQNGKVVSRGVTEDFTLDRYGNRSISVFVDATQAKQGLSVLKLELIFGDNVKAETLQTAFIRREEGAKPFKPAKPFSFLPLIAFCTLLFLMGAAIWYIKKQQRL